MFLAASEPELGDWGVAVEFGLNLSVVEPPEDPGLEEVRDAAGPGEGRVEAVGHAAPATPDRLRVLGLGQPGQVGQAPVPSSDFV